jgi:hypothetical protein
MIETKEEEFKEKREVVIKASCDYCGKTFDETTVICNGFGSIHIGFGYGSSFDDDSFHLEICDNCFLKEFGQKLEKQFKDKDMKWDNIQKAIKEGVENNNTK